MALNWWDAREAMEAGKGLADSFRPRETAVPEGDAQAAPFNRVGRDVEKLLQRAVREATPLKLNFFKRAKLLNSFKWRLIEHGFDASVADELTQMLLFQLYGARAPRMLLAEPVKASPTQKRSARRIPSMLAEGDAQFAAGQYSQAAASLRRVLRIDADHAIAHAKLGAALCYLGEYPEAERLLRRAVELDGRNADAHLNLGVLLHSKGEFAAAETALRRAIKLAPRNSEALVSLGLTLGARTRLSDAKDCFAKALVLKPRNASALCGLGWLAGIEGRFQDGEKLYRDALEADPGKSYAWASLAEVRRMTAADCDWLEKVKRLVGAGVPPLDESALRFALGKYYDDLGNFTEAFSHYKRANELQKLIVAPYDRKGRSSLVDDIVSVYTAEKMRPGAAGASESTKPLIVAGMMRSGTSLVEQIIASHPRASGAGELDFWGEAVRRHSLHRAVPDPSLAVKLAGSYLKILERHSRDAQGVVDKSTFNSDHLGLIHSVFPKARIIYVRRDPLDVCLSCYLQHFANAASFTLDLNDLAHYYREHHRLMQHWRSVLPGSVLLEVPYEGLVADQVMWTRRVLEFAGLEWDPRCLEYFKTERPILTASNWQVRQQIYSRSVARWQNYKKYIGPLLDLGELEPAEG